MRELACGLLETPYNFFIDHLAPLCSMLDAPIISSNPHTKLFYQKYYPRVHIVLKKWDFTYLMQNYQSVIYSFNPDPPFKELIRSIRKKYPNTPGLNFPFSFIYHFHGCSDKGYHSKWVDPKGHFKEIDLLLLYGERMEQILKDKNLYDLPKQIENIGNYRLAYYKEHQSFYDDLVELEVFSKFKRKKPILFYAPTWEDQEGSTSFHLMDDNTVKELTHDFNVLIKLHPNMTYSEDRRVTKKIERLKQIKNLLVLPFYPLVYPLLNRIDLYLGDHSSVGYDVLPFEKPMFFLNPQERSSVDPGALLLQCGEVLSKKDLYKLSEVATRALNHAPYLSKIRALKTYAFGCNHTYLDTQIKLKSIIQRIEKPCETS